MTATPRPVAEISNRPAWSELPAEKRAGFQEVWYLKLNDPAAQRALWLRFTLLSSVNGFRRLAETWAIYFQRNEQREVTKLALKQSHDLDGFGPGVKIADCELGEHGTRGSIHSKGRSIRWDLSFAPARAATFNLVPRGLARAGLVKNRAVTVHEDLRFDGSTEIDGARQVWKGAPGMQGHLSGPKNGHSWVWGHCNAFVDESGAPVDFVFEGLTARARLGGGLKSPWLSTLFFSYRGEDYRFNSVWDSVRCRSRHTLTDWEFQADRGDLSFRGTARAEHRDFAGVTYEDTDGSLLYCANSKLSEMSIHVYRRGKLERTLSARGTAAFEVVSRDRNPYVPLLI